jgi:hypothetical protein
MAYLIFLLLVVRARQQIVVAVVIVVSVGSMSIVITTAKFAYLLPGIDSRDNKQVDPTLSFLFVVELFVSCLARYVIRLLTRLGRF